MPFQVHSCNCTFQMIPREDRVQVRVSTRTTRVLIFKERNSCRREHSRYKTAWWMELARVGRVDEFGQMGFDVTCRSHPAGSGQTAGEHDGFPHQNASQVLAAIGPTSLATRALCQRLGRPCVDGISPACYLGKLRTTSNVELLLAGQVRGTARRQSKINGLVGMAPINLQ